MTFSLPLPSSLRKLPNVAGLARPVRESSSYETDHESLEELENPSEDVSLKLSFESLSCSLELELHTSSIF